MWLLNHWCVVWFIVDYYTAGNAWLYFNINLFVCVFWSMSFLSWFLRFILFRSICICKESKCYIINTLFEQCVFVLKWVSTTLSVACILCLCRSWLFIWMKFAWTDFVVLFNCILSDSVMHAQENLVVYCCMTVWGCGRRGKVDVPALWPLTF